MLGRSVNYQIVTAVALALFARDAAGAAPTPVVDTKSTSAATNVSREMLENLPVGRRVEDLVRTCPGNTIPTVSSQPQSLTGGGQAEPQYLIDGQPMVDINCIQPADIEMIEVYKAHNSARAEYGAPPLVWSPWLVQSAGGYVNKLSRTGQLVHDSREGRGTVRENISQGLPGWNSMQLTASWTKEKKNFIPGTFPNVSSTGNWYDIGHWAQMIWIQTVLIGCARAAGIGSSWLVCRYDPGGNKDGKPVGIPPPRPYLVEAPKLPTAEVFGQNASHPTTTAASDQPGPGPVLNKEPDEVACGNKYATAIGDYDPAGFHPGHTEDNAYGNGATTLPDLLDAAIIDDEFWGACGGLIANLSEDTRLELGVGYEDYDIVGAPFGGGIYWDPVSQVTVGAGVTYVDAAGVDLTDPFAPASYGIDEAFAEIRLPLLQDTPIFGGGQFQELFTEDEYRSALERGHQLSTAATDTPWSQDTLTTGNLTANMGLRYDAFDPNSPLAGNYLDFGISRNPFDQILVGDFGVPLTQNGSLNLAFIWLMSDTVTTIGADIPYKDTSIVRVLGADPVGLACRLDEAKITLDKQLAAGEWIDPAEYEKLYEEALGEAKAGEEADEKAGGGVDATLYNQNLDKSQLLMKTARAAAAKQTVDTKVESPELPTQEVFNPADAPKCVLDVM